MILELAEADYSMKTEDGLESFVARIFLNAIKSYVMTQKSSCLSAWTFLYYKKTIQMDVF